MQFFWIFFRGGGWGMWFVLAFGLVTLAQAIGFCRRPDARRATALEAFSRATRYAVIATVSLDLATVGSKVPSMLEWANSPKIHLIVMEGIAESLAPAILGCALLSFVWMIAAVGHRRLAREPSVD
jgi:hypothetical protein